jgi:serine/threonine-protein kinase RsbW
MNLKDRFEVTIPSDTEAGHAVQERILQALEVREFPPRDVFGVRLALEEALVNAIKHGNSMNPDKVVRVACEVTQDEVRIEIEDEGPGFDPKEIADPTEDENLDCPGGRGIMLMRAFMNLIEYNPQGNRVTLVKLRGVNNDSAE